MSWAFVAAVLLVAVVGVVVLRRRRPQRSAGFPWFWVTFPVAMLALVSALGSFLSRYAGVDIPEDDIVGLSQPYPDFNETVQFLSNEQFQQMLGPLPYAVYIWFFPVLGIVFTVASVAAVRKGRM
ncbi:hypothetical protein [Corynebacterium sp.]|uniref:hypothetical protein n=1 Tax=Corynebacterium sp. TaxID=1720 RepID=UPI0028AF2F3F|nr:hypothetical protein [Corynebacterium sp.]